MNVPRYDIRFAGELVPGADPVAARHRIQVIFGLSQAAVDWLFSGETLTIKRGVDNSVVAQVRERFREAGALIQVVPVHGGAPASWVGVGPERPDVPDKVPLLYGSSRPDRLQILVDKSFHYFEKTLAGVLLLLMSAVAVIAVIELCFVLYKDLVSKQGLLLSLNQLFEVFGMFLIVLIAIEFMASVYMYMMDKSVHVEMMLLIAITALTRKVVVMDLEAKSDDALYLVGMATLLGILIGGYFLVRRLDPRGNGGGRY